MYNNDKKNNHLPGPSEQLNYPLNSCTFQVTLQSETKKKTKNRETNQINTPNDCKLMGMNPKH